MKNEKHGSGNKHHSSQQKYGFAVFRNFFFCIQIFLLLLSQMSLVKCHNHFNTHARTSRLSLNIQLINYEFIPWINLTKLYIDSHLRQMTQADLPFFSTWLNILIAACWWLQTGKTSFSGDKRSIKARNVWAVAANLNWTVTQTCLSYTAHSLPCKIKLKTMMSPIKMILW